MFRPDSFCLRRQGVHARICVMRVRGEHAHRDQMLESGRDRITAIRLWSVSIAPSLIDAVVRDANRLRLPSIHCQQDIRES